MALIVAACGGRTIDRGEYGDFVEDGGSGGGTGGMVSGKGGRSSSGGGKASGSGSGGFSGNPSRCEPVEYEGPPIPLIDDMEDGDNFILRFEGRRGSWYAYNDGSGFQSPLSIVELASSPYSGLRAVYTDGYGFVSWGAGIGFLLNDNCPYDAARYSGVRFLIRSSSELRVRFSINTEAVTPVEHGGTCVGSCWDAHGAMLVVSEIWTNHAIRFENLAQEGFGSRVRFDRTRLTSVQFQIPAEQQFKLWIDEVSFF